MDKIKLLLIEEDEVLAMTIKKAFESNGFKVHIAVNSLEGWNFFKFFKPDVCMIDIMVPRRDGISMVRDIRQLDQQVTIISLSAKNHTMDILRGLEAGGDDYIKKPFNMEELITSVKSQVRRNLNRPADAETKDESAKIAIGAYTLNYMTNELLYKDTVITLSQRETDLLNLLVEHKNDLLNRGTTLLKIWGEDNIRNTKSMDVYITRLRKYFHRDCKIKILNVRGQGYKLIM
ncbi:response regulator transcription factor [Pedobacter sp. L105]|uniref:response regulator transcription factor n=1 Tax=Pedobacter sp. L105 TaxID=1641871 RepID=UPI00131D97AA|nr:response regulator transcription factor [Pedobacter sp. L105]